MNIRLIGFQVTAVSALFVQGFKPEAAPPIHHPVTERLQESARNMAEYLDSDLTPARTILGTIPTPTGWDTTHALHLIESFNTELSNARDLIPDEVYLQALEDTLSFTITLLSLATRHYNQPFLDRAARGPEKR